MAKKFDKISPKNISEEKFNQLVDALPSSAIEQSKAVVTPPGKKEKLDKVKVKKSKSQKLTKEEKQKTSKIDATESPISRSDDPKIEEIVNTREVFVYECGGVLFGIPVAYVTEITNDYGTI